MKVPRRSLLLGWAAPLLARPRPRLAICSETFAGVSFAEACAAARRTGYEGIEIEPAHLSPDPAALSGPERLGIRRAMNSEGLQCVGLHSLFKAPPGLHLTTPDATVRRRSWDYFSRLIDLAADISPATILVLGSAKQRSAVDGAAPSDATRRLIDGLSALAPHAMERGVIILMEPLAPHLCNVVNTLEEAMRVVRNVNSPAVGTMLDTHNTAAETKPLDLLIGEYLPHIRHVHLNEMDGTRPGAANFNFKSGLDALDRGGYHNWLSVEVFDFKPDGVTVAQLANEYIRRLQTVAAHPNRSLTHAVR
jgi:D-psicose/D-tagatose/L-ribulose 3-epimerase